MLYVLYSDPATGALSYETLNNQYTPNLPNDWQTYRPGMKLIAIFNEADNKITQTGNEMAEFAALCQCYGFGAGDYRAKVSISGKLYELVGFRKRNPRYPCLLRAVNSPDGKASVKTSPTYVRQHMI